MELIEKRVDVYVQALPSTQLKPRKKQGKLLSSKLKLKNKW